MCGIFGGIDRSLKPFGAAFARAGCERMKHRGPDDEGFYEADGILIGNRRLSILDVAGGHQPMFSDDGQIAVVQNGEIYNFVELARGLGCKSTCDTEVILRLYERDGEDFVAKLNGMFAIAILDRRRQRLLLYRDRVGKKPLYLYDDGERLLFASEIKSLLAVGVPVEMDPQALDAFLTYNFVPPPLTFFKNIRHLNPGHQLIVDRNGVQERAWWQLAATETEERSEAEWCEQIVATLDEAVRLRLRSDVPLGAFLSGGIDSSTVAALMSHLLPHAVKTFCIGFHDPRFDESTHAAEVASLIGAEHTTEFLHSDLTDTWPLAVYHSDQPHGDVSFLPTYWVSRIARQQVKVVLTGDGGDELFAGYDVHRRFFETVSPSLSQAEFEEAYIRAISLFSPDEKQTLLNRGNATAGDLFGADEFARQHFASVRHLDRINQALAIDVKLLLPGNNLVKPDRMAMAVSLEPRAPFLDRQMLDLAFRIPGELKLRGGVTKAIFKDAVRNILPASIIHRPKQMFTVPIGEWFKTMLLPFVREVLLSPTATERGLFLQSRVRSMIDDHATGRANHTRQLRALVAVELWQRMFVDAQFDHAPNFEELSIHSRVMSRAAAA